MTPWKVAGGYTEVLRAKCSGGAQLTVSPHATLSLF